MWDINLRAINEQDKQKLRDTDNSIVVTRGKGGKRRQKRVKGVKYMVTGDFTLGVEYTMQHTDDVLQNCTLETYIIILTNVTLINLIKKF